MESFQQARATLTTTPLREKPFIRNLAGSYHTPRPSLRGVWWGICRAMSLIYTSPTSRHNLYLGGKIDAKSLSTLQQRNVKRILNITPAKEQGITAGVPNYFENNTSSAGYDIRYKRIPIYDSSTSDILSYADEMIDFISNGLHHGGVLVHCQKGVSRSATAVIMFLMRKANMTMIQAMILCKRRRYVVDPIPSFLSQLRTYEEQCRTGGYLTAVDDDVHDVNDHVAKEDFNRDVKRKVAVMIKREC